MELTCDTELCGCITYWDKLVPLAVVVDDGIHGVGSQWNVVRRYCQRGGGPVTHLPVLTCRG